MKNGQVAGGQAIITAQIDFAWRDHFQMSTKRDVLIFFFIFLMSEKEKKIIHEILGYVKYGQMND